MRHNVEDGATRIQETVVKMQEANRTSRLRITDADGEGN